MILFQNSILKLDYNPATDILEVEYPNLDIFMISEIKHSISIMADIIRNYDIKRLILDATQTTVSVSQEESRDIAMFLAAELAKTRLQKVARLQSRSAAIETTAQENIRQIEKAALLPFLLRNFTTKTDAIEWLQEGTNS